MRLFIAVAGAALLCGAACTPPGAEPWILRPVVRRPGPVARRPAPSRRFAEIAYQDTVYCRMIPQGPKRVACRKEATARQARWRALRNATP
jgi:hypothetical protein